MLCCSELVEALADLLEKVGAVMNKPFVIMIDGLDYLSSENNPISCNWIPDSVPKVRGASSSIQCAVVKHVKLRVL